MTDYTCQIEQIKAAQSLDDIGKIASTFSAQDQREGAILYSGKVGNVNAMVIAQELARKTGVPIVGDTPRAQFVSDPEVDDAISKSIERLFLAQGMTLVQAQRAALASFYGGGQASSESVKFKRFVMPRARTSAGKT